MIKIQPVVCRRGEAGPWAGARCRKKGGGTPEECRAGEELGRELEADSGREWLRAEGEEPGKSVGRGRVSGWSSSLPPVPPFLLPRPLRYLGPLTSAPVPLPVLSRSISMCLSLSSPDKLTLLDPQALSSFSHPSPPLPSTPASLHNV